MRRTVHTISTSLLVLVLGALLPLTLTDRSEGQTFYRWTDERGIVHITDSPPRGVKYDTERLRPPPALAEGKTATDTADAKSEAGDAGDEEAKEASPARVIIEEQTNRTAGGATKTFAGKATNTGGTEARNVAIEITVTETVQGASCLRQGIPVAPSTLPPGESGSFSARFDNPCFHGPTDVQLTPLWD